MEESLKPVLDQLAAPARELLLALMRSRGYHETAEDYARSIGLANRHALARSLRRLELPAWNTLTGWFIVYECCLEAERRKISIAEYSLQNGRNPSTVYRRIHRVTGRQWHELHTGGRPWMANGMEVLRRQAAWTTQQP